MSGLSPEVLAAFAGLSAVIAVLWRRAEAKDKMTQEKLNKCEEVHREAHAEMLRMSGEVGRLSGRFEAVEAFGNRVLAAIKKNRGNANADDDDEKQIKV